MAKTEVAKKAREIRKKFKKYGWNNRHIQVKSNSYSMGSSIRITIKSGIVNPHKVKEIVKEFEDVRYDNYTGEILSGGNRFIFVEYDKDEISKSLPEMSKRAQRELFVAIEKFKADERDYYIHECKYEDFHKALIKIEKYDMTIDMKRYGFDIRYSDHAYKNLVIFVWEKSFEESCLSV